MPCSDFFTASRVLFKVSLHICPSFYQLKVRRRTLFRKRNGEGGKMKLLYFNARNRLIASSSSSLHILQLLVPHLPTISRCHRPRAKKRKKTLKKQPSNDQQQSYCCIVLFIPCCPPRFSKKQTDQLCS